MSPLPRSQQEARDHWVKAHPRLQKDSRVETGREGAKNRDVRVKHPDHHTLPYLQLWLIVIDGRFISSEHGLTHFQFLCDICGKDN